MVSQQIFKGNQREKKQKRKRKKQGQRSKENNLRGVRRGMQGEVC